MILPRPVPEFRDFRHAPCCPAVFSSFLLLLQLGSSGLWRVRAFWSERDSPWCSDMLLRLHWFRLYCDHRCGSPSVRSKAWSWFGLPLDTGLVEGQPAFGSMGGGEGLCGGLRMFLTQGLLCPCRRRGPLPPARHPTGHRDLTLCLLSDVLWCFRGTHPHDALLPNSHRQSLAPGVYPRWMGSCSVCSGCGNIMCPFIQVGSKGFSSGFSSVPAPEKERREGGEMSKGAGPAYCHYGESPFPFIAS